MNHYISIYNGLSGQARASSYANPNNANKTKANVFDSLQEAIGQHRDCISDHYNNVV